MGKCVFIRLSCPSADQLRTLIDQLWRRNCDVIEHFLNNGFSVSQAAGNENETQLLESFQYYQVVGLVQIPSLRSSPSYN